jgi:hypothetical protein
MDNSTNTHSPDPWDVPAAHAPSGALLVPLTWAQARRIRDRGGHVYYGREERTGRYRYSAHIRDVLAHPTPAMRARADSAAAAQCAALQAHARRACLRVHPVWTDDRDTPVRFSVSQSAHNGNGGLTSPLPADLTQAAAALRELQARHDRVYHPLRGVLA